MARCICICTCAASRETKRRRHWTTKEKLEILSLADRTSVMNAARIRQIDPRVIFSWRRNLDRAE